MIEIFLGLVVGLTAVLYVMFKAQLTGLLLNLDAFILVLGGTVGATIITFHLGTLFNAVKALTIIFFSRKKYSPERTIRDIVSIA